jgi:hypothetical protein
MGELIDFSNPNLPVSANPVCSVCRKPAYVECFIYDVYLDCLDVFFEQDFTCPYLCAQHFEENERRAFSLFGPQESRVTVQDLASAYQTGERSNSRAIQHASRLDCARPRTVSDLAQQLVEELEDPVRVPPLRDHRGRVFYPYTNRHGKQGFTIYNRTFDEGSDDNRETEEDL